MKLLNLLNNCMTHCKDSKILEKALHICQKKGDYLEK